MYVCMHAGLCTGCVRWFTSVCTPTCICVFTFLLPLATVALLIGQVSTAKENVCEVANHINTSKMADVDQQLCSANKEESWQCSG